MVTDIQGVHYLFITCSLLVHDLFKTWIGLNMAVGGVSFLMLREAFISNLNMPITVNKCMW